MLFVLQIVLVSYLLGDLEVAGDDEVDAVDGGLALEKHFLASLERNNRHVLDDLLDVSCPQVRENTEAAEERDNLLQLKPLDLADCRRVVALVQRCKSGPRFAQDGCSTAHVFQQS